MRGRQAENQHAATGLRDAMHDRRAFAIGRVDEAQSIFAGLLLGEIEDSVLCRSQAGHERGPGREGDGRRRAGETARMSLLHPAREIRERLWRLIPDFL